MPLAIFRNPVFVNATAIGLALGIGMFAAIGFVPTFLQMSSGTSAAESGLLMLPMMVGVMGMSIASGLLITKTGKYKIFPIVGTLLTGAAMLCMTTLTAATPIWLVCAYLLLFGAGLGCIMQVGSNLAIRRAAWREAGTDAHRRDPEIHDDLDLAFHLGERHRIRLLRHAHMGMSMRPFADLGAFRRRIRRGARTVLRHWPYDFPPLRWNRILLRSIVHRAGVPKPTRWATPSDGRAEA